jgi:hypothetical protein
MTARPRDQLRQAIDDLRIEMRITMQDMDAEACLQDGYFACGTRTLSGGTLDKVLKALGVKILLVPDDGAEEIQAGARINSRSDHMKACGKLRWEKIPKEERSAVARRAVQVRWDKKRRSAAMRSARTRNKNEAAMAIWERLILCGAVEPPLAVASSRGHAGNVRVIQTEGAQARFVTPALPWKGQWLVSRGGLM